ncbi:patatin-like phospholipase family protein [Domibacillus indicus]|uniref:patatin-like phospholipase family protein n=1 Tax=Domibacillus indicus TaxID=1437523 RepID=UPI000617AE4F|nr:patatin-like phospholipase family protein [Domibacillus indicus]
MKIDAVFEGGGVKGFSYIGAVQVLEKSGYVWNQLAGSSVGSITAALLAAGFTGEEMKEYFLKFPLDQLGKKSGISRIPFLGPALSLEFLNGIYSLSPLEASLVSALKTKGKVTFGDLPENKLKIVVSDITQNRMAILPDDLPLYHLSPDEFPIARAVTMSASVPFFFKPLTLDGNLIVDGSLLSNYPIWLFDSKETPRWPTFGFRLSGSPRVHQQKKVKGLVDISLALIKTMMEAHDKRYIESHNAARTIFIKGIPVSTTQFDISNEEKLQLIELGKQAAEEFLAKWNFTEYIHRYRA